MEFILLANEEGVKMLMVGGAAVNYYGYQRHSADVDFWIDTSSQNLKKLLVVLQKLGYEIDALPESVKNKQQNISLKFSPEILNIELITNFSVNKSFEEAYKDADIENVEGQKFWHIISIDDLITSKLKSGRNKDYLDVMELKKLHGK
ncbi:MAG: nucleotidyltransferase [Chitinophagales bacterium]